MTMPTKARCKARIIQGVAGGYALLQSRRAARENAQDELEFYYAVGDPHSHLAAQLLPRLQAQSKLTIRLRLVSQQQSPIYPEIDKQRRFALNDVPRLASAYGLQTVPMNGPPDDALTTQANAYLMAADSLEDFIRREWQAASVLFSGQGDLPVGDTKSATDVEETLQANNLRRERLGHYLPAMWQFRGDWFWGVDRVDALLAALNRAGLYEGPLTLLCHANKADLGETPSAGTPLEFFFSFRSPYSYLAAVQLQRRLSSMTLPLSVRPVLPMAMRGFNIPLAKRMYIVHDAGREAKRLGIPFGLISDPIGEGALRCLKVFRLAESPPQQLDFLVEAGRCAWAEAIDLATDRGLRTVCQRVGIDWAAAQRCLTEPLPAYAQNNLDALLDMGFWGVPSFRLGQFTSWGNDRMWMLDELQRRAMPSD
ncbi:DsbA family protein [Spongiibacter tropicus]|uniref:DsbA family protein n=1 Tax=Spongiibacter tropicus TaxID=454602 RepID=UPI003A9A4DD4